MYLADVTAPEMASDHTPLLVCFSNSRVRAGRRAVRRLLEYAQRVGERIQRVDRGEFDPFDVVEALQNILKSIAEELQRQPPPPASSDDAVRRRAHFLLAARQAAARGQLAELHRLRPHLGDEAGLFLSATGEPIAVCEADSGEAMRHAVLAAAMLAVRELPEDENKSEKASAIRSRADRELRQWGPGRRRFVSQTVVDRDGVPVDGVDGELRALEEHWGAVFGHTTRMDDDACERGTKAVFRCLAADSGRDAVSRGVQPRRAVDAG